MSIPNLIPHKTLYISGYIYSYYAFVFIFEFPEHISKHILQFHTSLYPYVNKKSVGLTPELQEDRNKKRRKTEKNKIKNHIYRSVVLYSCLKKT